MGISSDGQICFGVIFEEDHEFPWSDYEDIGEWWESEKNFTPTKEPWTADGERAEGITGADVDNYFKEKKEWLKENPLPVELVNYCSGDYPMWILAVHGSNFSCRRGYPEEFTKEELSVEPEKLHVFNKFLEEYELNIAPAKWYLSSCFG